MAGVNPKFLEEAYQNYINDPNVQAFNQAFDNYRYIDRSFSGNLMTGLKQAGMGMVGSTGGILSMMGADGIGSYLTGLEDQYNASLPQLGYNLQDKTAGQVVGDFFNPYSQMWTSGEAARMVGQGLGSAIGFMIPNYAGAKLIGMGLGQLAKLRQAQQVAEVVQGSALFGKVVHGLGGAEKAAQVGQGMLGSILPTALESATEAGSVYNDLVKEGVDHNTATQQAKQAFWQNTGLLGVSNALEVGAALATPGGRVLSSMEKAFGRATRPMTILAKMAGVGAMEGYQEIMQGRISDNATSLNNAGMLDLNWTPVPQNAQEAAEGLIGAVTGAGMGGGINLYNSGVDKARAWAAEQLQARTAQQQATPTQPVTNAAAVPPPVADPSITSNIPVVDTQPPIVGAPPTVVNTQSPVVGAPQANTLIPATEVSKLFTNLRNNLVNEQVDTSGINAQDAEYITNSQRLFKGQERMDFMRKMVETYPQYTNIVQNPVQPPVQQGQANNTAAQTQVSNDPNQAAINNFKKFINNRYDNGAFNGKTPEEIVEELNTKAQSPTYKLTPEQVAIAHDEVLKERQNMNPPVGMPPQKAGGAQMAAAQPIVGKTGVKSAIPNTRSAQTIKTAMERAIKNNSPAVKGKTRDEIVNYYANTVQGKLMKPDLIGQIYDEVTGTTQPPNNQVAKAQSQAAASAPVVDQVVEDKAANTSTAQTEQVTTAKKGQKQDYIEDIDTHHAENKGKAKQSAGKISDADLGNLLDGLFGGGSKKNPPLNAYVGAFL